MKNILLIGTSMIDQVFTTQKIHEDQCNKGKMAIGFGGSIHNVSYNLGCLNLNPIFITKLGSDSKAQEILDNLSFKGVETHPIYVKKHTPIFQSIQSSNKNIFLSTLTHDFLFNENDECDYTLFKDSYVVTDQQNEKFLLKQMMNSISASWIISGFIPSYEILSYTTGIIVNEDEFEGSRVDFKGSLKWIIATSESGATLLTPGQSQFIPCDKVETLNTLGAGDAFLAGLLYGLLRNCSLIDCIRIAHNTASIILKSPLATNPDLYKLSKLV